MIIKFILKLIHSFQSNKSLQIIIDFYDCIKTVLVSRGRRLHIGRLTVPLRRIMTELLLAKKQRSVTWLNEYLGGGRLRWNGFNDIIRWVQKCRPIGI